MLISWKASISLFFTFEIRCLRRHFIFFPSFRKIYSPKLRRKIEPFNDIFLRKIRFYESNFGKKRSDRHFFWIQRQGKKNEWIFREMSVFNQLALDINFEMTIAPNFFWSIARFAVGCGNKSLPNNIHIEIHSLSHILCFISFFLFKLHVFTVVAAAAAAVVVVVVVLLLPFPTESEIIVMNHPSYRRPALIVRFWRFQPTETRRRWSIRSPAAAITRPAPFLGAQPLPPSVHQGQQKKYTDKNHIQLEKNRKTQLESNPSPSNQKTKLGTSYWNPVKTQ